MRTGLPKRTTTACFVSGMIGKLPSSTRSSTKATIAVSKGRGPILWAVLGFFFPLIALIIIALLPRKDTAYR